MKIIINLEKIWVKACYDEDMVAESICGGQGIQEGHIFAVRRPCPGSETCETICESNELKAQDSQAKAQTYVYHSIYKLLTATIKQQFQSLFTFFNLIIFFT